MRKPLSLLLTTYYLLLFFAPLVHAQVDISEQFLLNESTAVASSPFSTPGGIISAILPNVFILASFILFLYFIFGGFTIITSHGDPEKTAKGKQAITGAIIGFAVIFISFWILQIIQIVTGVNLINANIPGLDTSAPSGPGTGPTP